MKVEQTFTVELEQRVAGDPETVFEYFTDPDKYRRWQGIEAELDPRPGGIFKVVTAPGVCARGEYLAVEAPHRIMLTWGFESEGTPLPRGLEQVPPGTSTVEFRFVGDGDGTIIRMRHTGLPSAEACWAHEQGWTAYLPRLEVLGAGKDPGEDPILRLAEILFARDANNS